MYLDQISIIFLSDIFRCIILMKLSVGLLMFMCHSYIKCILYICLPGNEVPLWLLGPGLFHIRWTDEFPPGWDDVLTALHLRNDQDMRRPARHKLDEFLKVRLEEHASTHTPFT